MFYILPFCYVCKSFTRKLVKTKYTENGITKILEQLKFCGLENDWIYPDIPVSLCFKCSRVLDFMYKFKKMFLTTNKTVHQHVLKLKNSNAEFNRLSVVLNASDAIVTSKESIKKSRNSKQNLKVPANVRSKSSAANIDITEKNTNLKSFPNTAVGTMENVTKGVKLHIDLSDQHTMSPSKSKTDVHKNSNNFDINIDAVNNSRLEEKQKIISRVHGDMTDKTAQLIKLGNLKKCMQYKLNKFTSPTLENIENLPHPHSVTGTHHRTSEYYENNQLKSKELERTNIIQPVVEELVAEFSLEQILINQEMCTQDNIDSVSVDNNASNSQEKLKFELPDLQPNTEEIFAKEERREELIIEENIVQNNPTISAPIIAEYKMEEILVKEEDQLCTENNISNHYNFDVSYLPESTNVTFVNSNKTELNIAKNSDDNVQPNLVSTMKHKLINILRQSDPQLFSNHEDMDGSSDSEMINDTMEQIESVNSEQFIISIDQSGNHANAESTVISNPNKQFFYKCSFCKGNFLDPTVFAQHLLSCEFEKKQRKLYNASEDVIVIDENTIECSYCNTYFPDLDTLATHASSNSCGPMRKIRKLRDYSIL